MPDNPFQEETPPEVLGSAVSGEAGHEEPCGSKATQVMDTLETTDALGNGHNEIGGSPQNQVWDQHPSEGCLQQCPEWAANRRGWKPQGSRKAMGQLHPGSHGGH